MNILKHILIVAVLFLSFSCRNEKKEVTVFTLNIWQEATKVDGAYEAIVGQVVKLNPDFVSFTEVQNNDGVDFGKRMVKSLEKHGLKYYSFRSFDSGLLSKYPIIDSSEVYYIKNDYGTIHKLITTIDGERFAIYSAHLDYRNYACYLPRGYDGNTWKKLESPITDVALIEKMNNSSTRPKSMKAFVEDARKESDNGSNIILAGDFNEPSLLDWTEDTKNLYDHNGVVYKWDVSKLLLENNFIDSYREMYPSAVENPGFTYPSVNKSVPISQLAWAPEADDRERIDFIYYKSNGSLKLQKVSIVGPRGCIKNGKEYVEPSKEEFVETSGIWPTDHKGLFAVFELK